jgi:Rps23 Pro-64 3,4-dihydroxylase Tpa1-like proline 4-hydroxylase
MHNDMESGRSENILIINGKVVGFDPSNFERSDSYVTNFNKIGNNKDNIKVINDFLSLEECKMIIDSLNSKEYVEHDLQIDDKNNPTIKRKSYMGLDVAGIQQQKVQKILEDSYDVKVIPGSAHVAKWEPGQKLELHVDDLGRTSYNHMASLIYLNDDYEGGEIEFPTHNVSLKLSAGSLIMFPGNEHYPHEVKPILSGYRYTMPLWFTFA